MSLSKFFTVEYTETRPLPKKWQWIGPASYIGIFLLTIVVAIVNVALVGYDTVSGFAINYNKMERHWYHKLIPSYKPMQICEPATFSVGQSIFSTVSLFNWRVVASTQASDRSTGDEVYDKHLIYRGETLDRCALMGITMFFPPKSVVSIFAIVQCNFTGDITQLVTSHKLIAGVSLKQTVAGFPASDEFMRSMETVVSQSSSISHIRLILDIFYSDGVDRLYNFTATTQEPALLELSRAFCPAYNHSCPGVVPEAIGVEILGDRKLEGDRSFQTMKNTAFEYARIIAAAIAIDLGHNRTDNNLFLNQTLMNQTLSPEFLDILREYQPPATSDFSPSRISTLFLCNYQRLKSSGSLAISVFAATFTVVAGAWNLRTIIVGYIGRETSVKSRDGSKEDNKGDPKHGDDKEVGETETLIPRDRTDND